MGMGRIATTVARQMKRPIVIIGAVAGLGGLIGLEVATRKSHKPIEEISEIMEGRCGEPIRIVAKSFVDAREQTWATYGFYISQDYVPTRNETISGAGIQEPELVIFYDQNEVRNVNIPLLSKSKGKKELSLLGPISRLHGNAVFSKLTRGPQSMMPAIIEESLPGGGTMLTYRLIVGREDNILSCLLIEVKIPKSNQVYQGIPWEEPPVGIPSGSGQ